DVAIGEILDAAFARHDLVIFENYPFYTGLHGVTRPGFLRWVVMKDLLARLIETGAKLVLTGPLPDARRTLADLFGHETAMVRMRALGPADYRAIAGNILGADLVADVDFALIHRYASVLDGHQLRLACELVRKRGAITTDGFIDVLETDVLISNIRGEDVE